MVKKLPEIFLDSLKVVEGFNRKRFEEVHTSGAQVTSVRINPFKFSAEELKTLADSSRRPLVTAGKVPWSDYGYYLAQRPSFTFDPLFHAGCYYVQEASSMFLEQAFLQCADRDLQLKVLDLCAAPGGKSTHLQSLLPAGSLLVSNEVIKTRTPVLTDNIIKWGAVNVIVTNNDPSSFKRTEGYFDVMVVDAPCSGSGLFRRDENAIAEWSLNAVQLCSQRQQRILADALPALKEDGLLIYSTCSYSRNEDEDILDWLVNDMQMESLPVAIEEGWNIVRSHSPVGAEGYRFYPDRLKGEGFFIACFRKKTAAKESRTKPSRYDRASAKERDILMSWLVHSDWELVKDRDRFLALPPSLADAYAFLKPLLNVQYAGVVIGQIMKERLVPEHALALSGVLSGDVPVNELPYDQAIKYLQRQEMGIDLQGKGWQAVSYQGHNLGWINVLPNRINNYYPKEIRILKQSNDARFEK